MTLDEIRHRAKLNRDCGLPKDAAMIEALGRVFALASSAAGVQSYSLDALRQAVADVEAL